MNSLEFEVQWTEKAESLLSQIKDTTLRKRIVARANRLKAEPVKQGEPLKYALSGFYSAPVAQRYLLIYQVKQDELIVIIHAVGIHRQGEKSDVYNVVEPE